MPFRLECKPCGSLQDVDGPEPRSALDVMTAAEAVGWLSFQDFHRSRMVVFCSKKCCSAALTKDGFFRRDLGRGRMKAHASYDVE